MSGTVSALDLPFEEAIAYLKNKTNATSQHWTDIWQRANARAFTVAGGASEALVEDFRREIERALETGSTLAEFKAQFNEIVARHGWQHTGSPGWRATVIYETNLSMAYSAGRYAQQMEPETLAAFPYLQYNHSGARHPRLEHLVLDGITLRADDPFWDTHYTPNGWGCGCWIASVSESGLRRQGKSGPDEAPVIQYRDWTNPKTGEVHQVPTDIDPGFDYNPGKMWQSIDTSGAPAARSNPALVSKPAPAPVHVTDRAQLPAANKLLESDYQNWADGLKQRERSMLASYKGNGYMAYNDRLRTGAGGDFLDARIKVLTDALARAETKRAITVYRGVKGLNLSKIKKGLILRESGFMSTSINGETAKSFGGSVFEIRIPEGFKGAAYVHSVPYHHLNEYEFLIKPGTDFRVIKKRGNIVVMEPVLK